MGYTGAMLRSAHALRLALALVLIGIVAAQGLDLGLACELHCPMRMPHRCCEPFSHTPSPCCTAMTHPPPHAPLPPGHGPAVSPPVALGAAPPIEQPPVRSAVSADASDELACTSPPPS